MLAFSTSNANLVLQETAVSGATPIVKSHGACYQQDSAFGMESMVTHGRLHNTWPYLTPGICSLIKPDALEKFMPFPTQNHKFML